MKTKIQANRQVVEAHLRDISKLLRRLGQLIHPNALEHGEIECLLAGTRALLEGHPTPHRPRGAGIITRPRGDEREVLFVQRIKGTRQYLALPGGGIDVGEEPEAGAAREVEEETGLKVTGLLPALELDTPGRREYLYFMEVETTEAQLGGDEAEGNPEGSGGSYELVWLTPDEAQPHLRYEYLEPVRAAATPRQPGTPVTWLPAALTEQGLAELVNEAAWVEEHMSHVHTHWRQADQISGRPITRTRALVHQLLRFGPQPQPIPLSKAPIATWSELAAELVKRGVAQRLGTPWTELLQEFSDPLRPVSLRGTREYDLMGATSGDYLEDLRWAALNSAEQPGVLATGEDGQVSVWHTLETCAQRVGYSLVQDYIGSGQFEDSPGWQEGLALLRLTATHWDPDVREAAQEALAYMARCSAEHRHLHVLPEE